VRANLPDTVANLPGRIGALELMREPRVYAVDALTDVRVGGLK
jgi:hypothetical protein